MAPRTQAAMPRKRAPASDGAGSASSLSASQRARLSGARTREARQRLAEEKARREAEVEARSLTSMGPLIAAFGGVLTRSVEQLSPEWVIDRYAELGQAAATQNDLPTIRGVLGD